MSKKAKDGGPAFPVLASGEHVIVREGISSLDYFAAAAMEGQLAAMATPGLIEATNTAADVKRMSTPDFIATSAYIHAEAMLAERERRAG